MAWVLGEAGLHGPGLLDQLGRGVGAGVGRGVGGLAAVHAGAHHVAPAPAGRHAAPHGAPLQTARARPAQRRGCQQTHG